MHRVSLQELQSRVISELVQWSGETFIFALKVLFLPQPILPLFFLNSHTFILSKEKMTSIKHHVTIESVEDEGEKRFQDVVPSSRSQCINLAEMMNGYDFEGEAPSDRMTSWVS